MEKESFVLYTEYAEHFELLNDSQLGKLIRAIFAYVKTGQKPVFDDRIMRMAFGFIQSTLDRDLAKYEKRRQINKEAVEKRWENSRKRKSASTAEVPPKEAAKTPFEQ